ncbi:hypothetical protein HPB51_027306 [Rhipicephalus microplus]|uniref:Uncharacterized protein n=1 Tax=Rhipicephalus microplus TaxID=6941 RepID=A0A9J6D0S4_RHIMP|nr:hypothetical protein HPB51_027306 [Rhipicephalus microplus]
MDSTGESQTASVRQSEPGLGEEVMDFAAQNRDEAALPGNCNAASTHADADFSAPTETDRTEEGWQISQSLRAKKKQTKERKFQQGGDFSAGSRPTTDNQPKRRGRPTRRRPPALPKDDLKVVLRPHHAGTASEECDHPSDLRRYSGGLPRKSQVGSVYSPHPTGVQHCASVDSKHDRRDGDERRHVFEYQRKTTPGQRLRYGR